MRATCAERSLTASQYFAQCRNAGLEMLSGGVNHEASLRGLILPLAHLLPRRLFVPRDVNCPSLHHAPI